MKRDEEASEGGYKVAARVLSRCCALCGMWKHGPISLLILVPLLVPLLQVTTDLDAKGAAEEAPSDEEMDGINNIVGDTKIVRFLESQARTHSDKIDKLRTHLDDQVKGLHNHLKSMLEQVRRDEQGTKRPREEKEPMLSRVLCPLNHKEP